jgi:hypothetical protein
MKPLGRKSGPINATPALQSRFVAIWVATMWHNLCTCRSLHDAGRLRRRTLEPRRTTMKSVKLFVMLLVLGGALAAQMGCEAKVSDDGAKVKVDTDK